MNHSTNHAAMNDNPEVLYETDAQVATITLNRPERLNTISRTMLNVLTDCLLRAGNDPEVRSVILTGKGRVFCAGLDLASQAGGGDDALLKTDTVKTHLDLKYTPPTVLFEMDKPVICAMNGSAAGYGLDTALGCDIRIMANTAKMAASYTKRGILPESGGTWFLPRMLGWSRAAEMIFTGRTLNADQCLELGLVSKIVAPEKVMDEARALAEEIAANAPLAVQASKRLMRMGLEEPFPIHVHHVFLQLQPLIRTQDFKEGVSAFMEKREADFKGC